MASKVGFKRQRLQRSYKYVQRIKKNVPQVFYNMVSIRKQTHINRNENYKSKPDRKFRA